MPNALHQELDTNIMSNAACQPDLTKADFPGSLRASTTIAPLRGARAVTAPPLPEPIPFLHEPSTPSTVQLHELPDSPCPRFESWSPLYQSQRQRQHQRQHQRQRLVPHHAARIDQASSVRGVRHGTARRILAFEKRATRCEEGTVRAGVGVGRVSSCNVALEELHVGSGVQTRIS